MVTPACYPPSDAGKRYSRACPPYHIPYPDRRFHLSSQDGRTTTMLERDIDSESQPRKRIAVACGRCRKRKIRCSGDPGNGLPCTNCKNAGYEPCLFLRVQATETHLRTDGNDFGYNLEAARPYSNQSRVSISQLSPVPEYSTDISNGGVIPYRQNQYQYGSKGYYSMSGWANGYGGDEVDYGLNYPYQMIAQDASNMVQSFARYNSGKSVYVEPETPSYSYGSLVHRPAVSSESPTGFSLSGMAASLPSATDRVVPADRLLPQVNRTLTGSSSYRAETLPSYNHTKTPTPTSSISEVGYSGISSNFDHSYSTAPTSLPPTLSQRLSAQNDGAAYNSSATAAADSMYTSSDHPLRSTEDTSSVSYIYSDKADSSRRDSHSSGGASSGSVLPNGHIYVPDSHVSSSQSYSSQSSALDGHSTSPGRGSGSSMSSHMHADTHRRSAGNLRGG
ncbi:hypothetical protein F5B19DRAFT_485719 [Rostrohypoxylon terebratum]|nr:hypothetical protein F5B19DRAFT_485719 [Rostrohypoxylon terebratum]